MKLPPLREHKEDIPLLAGEFCRMLGEKHGRPSISISHAAMERLIAAEWKGNVRQLKNVLESAIVMSQGDALQLHDLAPDSLVSLSGGAASGLPGVHAVDPLFASILQENDFRKAREQFEVAYLKAQLRANRGNITKTAATIGMHRQSLQAKVRELGIQVERD